MILDDLDFLTSDDSDIFKKCAAEVSSAIATLKTLDLSTRERFETFLTDLMSDDATPYAEWSHTAKAQFDSARLVVKVAFVREGVFGRDGWPIGR